MIHFEKHFNIQKIVIIIILSHNILVAAASHHTVVEHLEARAGSQHNKLDLNNP